MLVYIHVHIHIYLHMILNRYLALSMFVQNFDYKFTVALFDVSILTCSQCGCP